MKNISWITDGGEITDAAYIDRKMSCFLVFSYVEFPTFELEVKGFHKQFAIKKKKKKAKEARQPSLVRQWII